MTLEGYVKALNLIPHPEGGWYRESYRSAGQHANGSGDFPGNRNYCTAIYFLIADGHFSALHRIKSDETWHFYGGDALEIVEINEHGELKKTIVGNDLESGNSFQYTVPAGVWFGSRVVPGGAFSLVGCTVSPGFDFKDFKLADRRTLLQSFPQHKNIIESFTHQE